MSYELIKAFHIISVISWMAGMFYLPRLYVYHANASKGSELSETFKIMERRLLKIIINPAMILTFIFGIWMLMENPALMQQGWLHAKIFLVLCLAGLHGFLAATRKKFERDENTRDAKFYKLVNEIPTTIMIIVVVLAVTKPF
jgi:protoporphyrinogen IX oxidase